MIHEHIVMGPVELKKSINTFMEKADDRVLRIVNGVFEHYYQNETVAFHPDGTPMNREAYISALNSSENQIDNNEIVSIEELAATD